MCSWSQMADKQAFHALQSQQISELIRHLVLLGLPLHCSLCMMGAGLGCAAPLCAWSTQPRPYHGLPARRTHLHEALDRKCTFLSIFHLTDPHEFETEEVENGGVPHTLACVHSGGTLRLGQKRCLALLVRAHVLLRETAEGVVVHACGRNPGRATFLRPAGTLHRVVAAHTRWLSMEGQVVGPRAAQSSVDTARAHVGRPLRGEEKSAFPYACARRNPPSTHRPPRLPSSAPLRSRPDGALNIVYRG